MTALGRAGAFTLLAMAAFAWVPPYLDRPGTAALGLAFLSLAVGRPAVGARPALPFLPTAPNVVDTDRLTAEASEMVSRMQAYGIPGGIPESSRSSD